MMRAWAWWVDLWDRREPANVLAVVRVLLGVVILWDFAQIYQLGLVDLLFAPQEAGGFPDVLSRDSVPELYQWFPATVGTARAAFGAIVTALVCFIFGVATPLSAVCFVLLSSQLAQVAPLADRGIDLLLRDVVFILAFSPCGKVWSVDAWLARRLGRPFAVEQPAWPRHLIVLQVVVMYVFAGIQKTALAWTPFGGFSALFLILQDPSIARFPFGWLDRVYPLTQLASVATLMFEWSAGLVPALFWFRATRERGGRLRAFANARPWIRLWLGLGVVLHLGIAATMQLGIFPWAMLALYPAFIHVDEWRALLGRIRSR